jgi:FMN phosphatase YigB (HAD superfamily)
VTPSKVIVTDCDGVLLDWEFAFDVWVAEKGYKRLPGTEEIFWAGSRYGIHNDDVLKLIMEFNESACIGFLPPLRDAVHYVKLLAEQGYQFDVVSSLHVDRYAQMLRVNNLTHLFGDVFRKINAHLSIVGSKEDFLREHYSDSSCWWIEDRTDHADAGANVGMKPMLMDHPYNQRYDGPALRVYNWQDIYDKITEQP